MTVNELLELLEDMADAGYGDREVLFTYQHNPVGSLWFDLEHAAEAAAFHVFSEARPTLQYRKLLDAASTGSADPTPTLEESAREERARMEAQEQRQAAEAGNWVLPGLEPPLLPVSQRVLRGLGISGPLWRLLRYPAMRRISRIKFRRPDTSWGIPNPRRIER